MTATDFRCTICRRPVNPERDPVRHEGCARRLTADLRAIPAHYALMGAVLTPGTGSTGTVHVSGTRTAPLPVRLEPLSLRARGGIVTILASWEAEWREVRGWEPMARGDSERALAAIVLGLRALLPWAIEEHPAVEEFAGDLRCLLHACRLAAGVLPKMTRIGDCPNIFDDGEACGAALYVDALGDVARCRQCGSRWPRGQWVMLGKVLHDGRQAVPVHEKARLVGSMYQELQAEVGVETAERLLRLSQTAGVALLMLRGWWREIYDGQRSDTEAWELMATAVEVGAYVVGSERASA